MNSPQKPVLSSLQDHELAGITFIRGYAQFLFEGPVLNAYTLPNVITSETIFTPQTIGYRDALCEQIGEKVTTAREEPGHKLAIQFSNKTSIEISLKDEDRVCAEAAMLQVDSGKRWNAW
jgi:hypothetical protein